MAKDATVSVKVTREVELDIDDYCQMSHRDNACALRYIIEVGLSACFHGFDEGLLKIKPKNNKQSIV
ncbi:hypothetical protein KAR91_27610 [Candidatus Pacearchaeota archaeon]|nr:hypothetical protein [Candidatus Pacearchaeota archaeon]